MNIEHDTPSMFCKWVVAKDYYDGPLSGIGLVDRNDEAVFFRVVAWDSEQWNRIFAVTATPKGAAERLRAQLARVEPAQEPFWLPGPQTNTPEIIASWKELTAAALSAQEWSLVESHDLLEAIGKRQISGPLAQRMAEMIRREQILELPSVPILAEFVRRLVTGKT